MEAELIRKEFGCYRCVCRKEARQEETVEVVLSEEQSDAAEFITAEVVVLLRSKECEDGLVRLRAVIEGAVLYADGDGKCFSVPLRSECRLEWTGQELRRDGQLCARLTLQSVEGKVLNPRKLLVSMELQGSISQWQSETVSYVSEARGEKLETRCEQAHLTLVADVSEKSFAVTEEYSLPQGSETVQEILLSRCASTVLGTDNVAGKLIIRGTTITELLYRDENAALHSLSFTSSWSQLMDVSAEPTNSSVTLMPTAQYVDAIDGGRAVALELHLTSQLQCSATVEAEALVDAYSTAYESALRRESVSFPVFTCGESVEQSRDVSIELPESFEELLLSSAEVGKSQNDTRELSVRLLYRTDSGEVRAIEKALPPELENVPIESCCVSDLRVSRNAVGLDMSIRMSYVPCTEQSSQLSWVDAITLDEDKPLRKTGTSGLIVVRRSDASLWELARKYGSTVALIEKVNENCDEKDAFLFIPRAR